jgi:hypothetical protein
MASVKRKKLPRRASGNEESQQARLARLHR